MPQKRKKEEYMEDKTTIEEYVIGLLGNNRRSRSLASYLQEKYTGKNYNIHLSTEQKDKLLELVMADYSVLYTWVIGILTVMIAIRGIQTVGENPIVSAVELVTFFACLIAALRMHNRKRDIIYKRIELMFECKGDEAES